MKAAFTTFFLPVSAAWAQAQVPPQEGFELRDVVPPVEVLPYPPWMVFLAAGICAVVLGFVVLFLWRWWQRRPAPPPPTPRQIALLELKRARQRLETFVPYEFSILISDILRSYLVAQYGLGATRQTSPEFLASASESVKFSAQQKALLEEFLGKCDLIKFARIEADQKDCEHLLRQAADFVEEPA